jgi:nitrogen fixation protein FixH
MADMTASRSPRPAGGFRLTGWHVLAAMVTFFGIIFAVNFFLVHLALSTMPGVEVDSVYRSGQAMNGEFAAERAREAAGTTAEVHVERDATGLALVTVRPKDREGRTMTGLTVGIRLARPTDRRGDLTLTLRETEAGFYRGRLDDVAAGQWDVHVAAEKGETLIYRSRNRIVLH